MTVVIAKEKLIFVSAPKVACTSIKEALFEVENGFVFRDFTANGAARHVHHPAIYPALPFSKIEQESIGGFLKITMVRDPVKRFLSAYANRVVYYEELSDKFIGDSASEHGVPVNPDLHEFVEHLFVYREISNSVRLHTQPLVYFLGDDSSFYDRVFDISGMTDFDALVSSHIKKPYSTPHLQTGGPKIPVSELTDKEILKIKKFYEADYRAYGEYF